MSTKWNALSCAAPVDDGDLSELNLDKKKKKKKKPAAVDPVRRALQPSCEPHMHAP